MQNDFHMGQQAGLVGSSVYLLADAFGSQMWAPWSEELGRRMVIQVSLAASNLAQLPCALAPNYASVIVGRFFAGVFQASGSVAFGAVADMWGEDDQAYAVAFIVLSYVGGSAIGPIFGPFVEAYTSWRWVFWVQLILGGVAQALHYFTIPETRSTIILDREAKRRRRELGEDVWGPNEVKAVRISRRELITICVRPVSVHSSARQRQWKLMGHNSLRCSSLSR